MVAQASLGALPYSSGDISQEGTNRGSVAGRGRRCVALPVVNSRFRYPNLLRSLLLKQP
jgi:hypothetical protein